MSSPQNKQPYVSIIIVARDEENNIGNCLCAVRSQIVDFSYEIIVVDSGSTDKTVKIAKQYDATVIEIKREDFQHGRTRQMASMQAGGEYLVYLVADAVPADNKWLAVLVDAVRSDDMVAGAYSRQIPRDGAGPVESHRLRHRLSSGLSKETRKIDDPKDFWSMTAADRFTMCEFDDVSCCRRRSLLDEFPIRDVDWAEDLLWAREVLLAGHKIVFEPGSVVKHSHADNLVHAFKRGYLDQAVVKNWFGVIYFSDVKSLLKGYPRLFLEQAKAISLSDGSFPKKISIIIWNAFRLTGELFGNFAASQETVVEHIEKDLTRGLASSWIAKKRYRNQVLKTSFTVGDSTRKVLFMNPDAAANTVVIVPKNAVLKIFAAINPEAGKYRDKPILFGVAINGDIVWQKEIFIFEENNMPVWTKAKINLSNWENEKVNIIFMTLSDDTDYGWAGFSRPRITVSKLSFFDLLKNKVLERIENIMKVGALRHP